MQTNILLESGTNELEIVEFYVEYKSPRGEMNKQYFGVNVAKIREIIRMPEITKMPNLPPAVCGVFNLRDKIIPAFDLSQYLYKLNGRLSDHKMIIAEFNQMQVGFIVKDVQRIHRISWKEIISPESMEEFNPESSAVTGILQYPDRHIFMLDVERIVAEISPNSAIDLTTAVKLFNSKPIALTAEDSMIVRKMITSRLEAAGFEVKAFHNGEDAWAELENISQQVKAGANIDNLVNIIITDIEMPKMDGYTLTKYIKDNPELRNVPVVIFSSIINQDILHKGRNVGASAQLSKPQIGELLDTIRGILAHKHE